MITEHDDSSKDLNMFVETGAEYVDKEFLLPGLYQYIGTYSYKAVSGSNCTVRQFKQLEWQRALLTKLMTYAYEL